MLLKQIENTIKKYGLLDTNDRILVGVSGGPDSVALLYVLNRLKKKLRIKLYIAHLDHMLRPDSAKDREFVEGLARRMKLPVTCAQTDVKKVPRRGSTEEAARNARLNFLRAIAKKIKADKIALGHNLDDQAETVLMRVIRGTGLQGLSGILPKKTLHGITVVRPLIKTPRRDIEAFLKKRKIRVCRDITNLDEAYFRNKIRRRLIPLLETGYNKNIRETLANLAESSAEDYDYLSRASERAFTLKLDKLKRLHPAIRRMVLRSAITSTKAHMRRIAFKHMQELEDLIDNRPVNSIVDLPEGISAVKTKTFLKFVKRT